MRWDKRTTDTRRFYCLSINNVTLLPFKKRRELFKAFIEQQFAYCPLVWFFHDRDLNAKINRLQERALRLVYEDYVLTYDELLDKDKSVTIHHRNVQLLAIELYKIRHSLSVDTIDDIFIDRSYNGPGLRKK